MLILDKLNFVLRNRIKALGGHSRSHVLDGQHVHSYELEGRGHGPPLVLLHGLGDSSLSWVPLMRPLAARHTVIAPALLGHGESDKPRADY